MLAENICSNYEDVKLLAIYKPDTTEDLYIKNCEKFIRLDKLSAPKDLIVNETNGTFILTTAKIDEAKEYKILINGEFFNNTTDGTYDLTIDDIHNIRVENSKRFETMTREEIKNFYKEQVKIFNNNLDEIKNKNLQVV